MPEHKMLDRKTEEEKLRKGLQDDTMGSEPGKALEQSNFMDEERQGLQGDEGRAKQLYDEKKGNLSQVMKEGVEPPRGDVQPGQTFEKDAGAASNWVDKNIKTPKEEGWTEKPIQRRGEPQQPSPERKEWPEGSEGTMTGKANDANTPSFKGDVPGTGIDERKEKQINEEIMGNIPKVPQEGKDQVEDTEKGMVGNKIDENDPRKRKSQL